MLNKQEIQRYDRHLILEGFGMEAQQKLKNSSVLVVGAGGLGSSILPYLAAAGVGKITIIDYDTIDESNLQRQVLFDSDMIGKSKVAMAANRLRKLNPHIEITPYNQPLTAALALELFPDHDVIIDGTDNFATRYLINDACVILNKPLVYGAIFRFEGQVSVFNYSDKNGTYGPTYRCLYPEPPKQEHVPDCSQAGVLGVLPGYIGILQATEAIKVLTGIGEVLSGRVMFCNLLTAQTHYFTLEKNEIPALAPRTVEALLRHDYTLSCSSKVNELSCREFNLMDKSTIQVLDVREPHETPKLDGECINIPVGEIEEKMDMLDIDKTTVVVCQSGKRSIKAITILKQNGFRKLKNLTGGVNQLMNKKQEL